MNSQGFSSDEEEVTNISIMDESDPGVVDPADVVVVDGKEVRLQNPSGGNMAELTSENM